MARPFVATELAGAIAGGDGGAETAKTSRDGAGQAGAGGKHAPADRSIYQ